MMNKRSPRLLAIFSAAALLMSSAAAYSVEAKNAAAPAAAPARPLSAPAAVYLVRDLDGYVAVFSGSSGDLLRRTDYPIAALPLADRTKLTQGIPVDSDEDLALLLEDYQS